MDDVEDSNRSAGRISRREEINLGPARYPPRTTRIIAEAAGVLPPRRTESLLPQKAISVLGRSVVCEGSKAEVTPSSRDARCYAESRH